MNHFNLTLLVDYGKRVKELGDSRALPEGYYLINSVTVTPTQIAGFKNIHAEAMWHPKEKEVRSAYPVAISLSPLYTKYSFGPKELNPEFLKDLIIHITKCEVQKFEYAGIEKQQVVVDWSIVFPKLESNNS